MTCDPAAAPVTDTFTHTWADDFNKTSTTHRSAPHTSTPTPTAPLCFRHRSQLALFCIVVAVVVVCASCSGSVV